MLPLPTVAAATATATAIDPNVCLFIVVRLILYNLYAIGNAEFANSFVAAAISQNVSPPLWRIIHYHDPVPRLPPSIGKGGLHPVVHPPLEIYYTNRESSEYIVCPQQEGAIENTSSLCMAGWPSYLSLNTDHISYLNESFAYKDFPDECKATS